MRCVFSVMQCCLRGGWFVAYCLDCFSSVCKNDSMAASQDHTHSKPCPRFSDSLHGHRYFLLGANSTWAFYLTGVKITCGLTHTVRDRSSQLSRSLSPFPNPLLRQCPLRSTQETYKGTISPRLCKHASTWRLYSDMIATGNISNSTHNKSLNTNARMVSESSSSCREMKKTI